MILFFSPQTSTPLLTRQLSNRKSFTTEPVSPRRISETDSQPMEEINKTPVSRSMNKRKHSTNSLSPISNTPTITKKRAKNESSIKKPQSKSNHHKRKESITEDDQSDNERQAEPTGEKRRLSLDLSSK